MPSAPAPKAALLSVSDTSGIVELAQTLSAKGYTLLTTSGTGKALQAAGIASTAIEHYTGQKEILDGRVKTLHPKIHAGILARRDAASHLTELMTEELFAIDLVVVNLYPFGNGLSTERATNPVSMIELIDVGGPSMLRGAAKNFLGVLPVIDPADYATVQQWLQTGQAPGGNEFEWRRALAVKVFAHLAKYDLSIARYMSAAHFSSPTQATIAPESIHSALCPVTGVVLERVQTLRYGENPHQQAAAYTSYGTSERGWQQLQGKELSYNNLLDLDAALRLNRSLSSSEPTVVIVKHLNPCGAARGETALAALQRAKQCDPRSHFGGILCFNCELDGQAADNIAEDFAEIIIAPSFSSAACQRLAKNKNLRLIAVSKDQAGSAEWRSIVGGFVVQTPDASISQVKDLPVVTKRPVTDRELADLQFAWTICAGVKSNTIVIVRDGLLIGVGAGQMSRIDSVELALHKARTHGHSLSGAVAASDAFFPFPDGVEALAAAGISAVVAPGGAKRDPDVTAAANRAGISLIHAPDRHFRH